MPYVIEAQAARGYVCRVTFRVKRDAFAVAQMCACLLHFPEPERELLRESRLGPEMPELTVKTDTGRVTVKRQ